MHPAHTRYQKSVVDIPDSPPESGLLVLKAADTNKKLGAAGKRITRGRYRDKMLYSLTLEERATCWSGCQNWDDCYGSNMPFAKRYKHGPELEEALTTDVALLEKRHRKGFVVRLHVLGDFYSVEYVDHWAMLLETVPALHVFGYTHWPHSTPIGYAVSQLVLTFPDRAAFRRSDQEEGDDILPSAMTIGRGEPAAPGTVICPEQTGQTAACTTCGLCMNLTTSVSFIDHSRKGLRFLPLAA